MTQPSHFEQLLALANQQPEPQRLLFVFLKAVLPVDSSPEELASFESANGGQLKPMMSVDKALEELSTFEALLEESKETGKEWQMVLIAAMPGRNGNQPTAEEVEGGVDTMIKVVQGGGDISQFMTLDRNGEPVQFS
jgi:hypothetical protein